MCGLGKLIPSPNENCKMEIWLIKIRLRKKYDARVTALEMRKKEVFFLKDIKKYKNWVIQKENFPHESWRKETRGGKTRISQRLKDGGRALTLPKS